MSEIEGCVIIRECTKCGEKFAVRVGDPQEICRICYWIAHGGLSGGVSGPGEGEREQYEPPGAALGGESDEV